MPKEAVIHRVSAYELHGVPYYQLIIAYEDSPETLREVRLAQDMVYASPEDGDRVVVEAILSVVTEVKKKD